MWTGSTWALGLAVSASLVASGPARADGFFVFDEDYDITLEFSDDYVEDGPGRVLNVVVPLDVSYFGMDGAGVDPQKSLEDMIAYLEGRGQNLSRRDARLDGFIIAGLQEDGDAFLIRSLHGQTCEGEPVVATLMFEFPPEDEARVAADVAAISQSLHIGACG